MSNAPSLKEPSMEEILASIRRIIESGDDKTKPSGDVLHDDPAPAGAHHDHADHAHADGPSWDFGGLARDFAPANADAPPASGERDARNDSADAVPTAHPDAVEATIAAPAGVFVAEMPERAELAEPVLLEPSPEIRQPRREPMPRRNDTSPEGLSLSSAYRREAKVMTDTAPDEQDGNNLAGRREDHAEVAEPFVESAPAAESPAGAAGLAGRIAESVDADFTSAFDEEQFSSELRVAVGLDHARRDEGEAPAEPSVITAASTLMSEAAGAQVAAAFDDLARAIRDGQMKSMEDMAREMLRPMLQEWLDDNLPRIVERMVREEIERVSRGPRR